MKRLVWKCAFAAVLLASSAACRAAPFAYFVDQALGSVTPIDVATNQVLESIVVGGKPVSVAAAPVGHSVFVGNLGSPGTCVAPPPGGGAGGSVPASAPPYVSVVDSSSRKVVARINLPLTPALLRASSDSTRLYIVGTDPTDPCSAAAFFGILDTASRQLVKRVALPGVVPTDMVADTSHSRVYVRSAGAEVDVVHASTGGILARIDIGPAIFGAGLALDEANGRLYAASQDSVTAIDTSRDSILWRVPTSANPLSLALHPSGSPLVVAETGSEVEMIDVSRRSVARSFGFPAPVQGVGMSPDGGQAYVVSGSGALPGPDAATPIRMADWTAGSPRSIGTAVAGGQFIGNLSDPPGYLPDALTGLWWNPAQPGWGMQLAQHRGAIFAVWFTYDEDGNPKWYAAPQCDASVVPTDAPDANCSSELFEVHGPSFFPGAFDPRTQRTVAAGTLQLRFQDADHATYAASVNGQAVSGSIERQIFRTGPVAGTNYTDLWYNPTEPGWGLGIAHEGDVMFLVWFVYDDAGDPEWLVAPSCIVKAGGDGCTGALYSASGPMGPAAGVPFDPSKVSVDTRGEVDLTFDGPDAAVIRYTVDGKSAAKAVIRQPL